MSVSLATIDQNNNFTLDVQLANIQANFVKLMAAVNGGSGSAVVITAGKTLTVDNTLELAGTDGTKMTFPSVSGTVVTLAGTQTLSAKTLTAPVINTPTVGPIVAGVTAGGAGAGSQANATGLTGVVNSVDTNGNNANGVVLPAGAAGDIFFIFNNTSHTLQIYGNATATINAAINTTGINLGVDKGCMIVFVTATIAFTVGGV